MRGPLTDKYRLRNPQESGSNNLSDGEQLEEDMFEDSSDEAPSAQGSPPPAQAAAGPQDPTVVAAAALEAEQNEVEQSSIGPPSQGKGLRQGKVLVPNSEGPGHFVMGSKQRGEDDSDDGDSDGEASEKELGPEEEVVAPGRSARATSSSEDPSSDGDDSNPCPHMHQLPPREPGTGTGDEDTRTAGHYKAQLSALPFLHLQVIASAFQAFPFPPLLSLLVNNRGGIDYSKLSAGDVNRNVLLCFAKNRDRNISPISGDIHVLLHSFSYHPDGGCENDHMTSLCGSDTSLFAGKFEVRQMTTADCELILEWLDQNITFDPSGEGALAEGKRTILEELGKVPLHGNFKQLAEWVESKTWNESGTAKLHEEAIRIIQEVRAGGMEADEARISLRRVLLVVIPYQLKMACAVLDGVHRMAAVLCTSTGACPQNMEQEPRNQVDHFTNSLCSTEPDGSGMGVASTSTGEDPVDINTQVTLVDWGGQETLNSEVLDVMRNKSKKLQEYACSGDEHTAKSVIDGIMICLVERLAEGPGCLFVFDPSNEDPVGSALTSEQESPKPNRQERVVQIDNFLHSINISPEIRQAHLDSIQGKKNWGVLHELFLQTLHGVVGRAHGKTHQNSSDGFLRRELKSVGGVTRQSAG